MSERKTYFCVVKELVRHIEILLLEHDCVTIPQIGGFVTCNVPARYIKEENLFLPPYRTVGFNEQLKTDDGLLIRSFADTYGVQEAEAKKKLGACIREMQQELWENGSYDLGSIGVLAMDAQNNTISFAPCQAGTVCPAYYGLDALVFSEIEASYEAEEMPLVQQLEPEYENKEKEITIRLKKSWLNNVAAVAAAVIMFFLFSPKAANTEIFHGEQAEFTNLMSVRPVVKTVPVQPIETKVKAEAEPMTTPEPVGTKETKVEETSVAVTESHTGFCVVVASAITEKNANAYVEQLHKRGYKEATVYKKGKMVRVIFPGFSTEAAAHAKMNILSDISEEFANAWVYEIK